MPDAAKGYRARKDDDQSWDMPTRPISRPAGEVNRPRRSAEEQWRQQQLEGIQALLALSVPVTVNPAVTVPLFIGTTPRRPRSLLKDPALRGAIALMLSATMAGGLGFVFWAFTAHHQSASAVGGISAEVSSITFLAGVGSLNLIGIFGRFLPVAGWR